MRRPRMILMQPAKRATVRQLGRVQQQLLEGVGLQLGWLDTVALAELVETVKGSPQQVCALFVVAIGQGAGAAGVSQRGGAKLDDAGQRLVDRAGAIF